MDLQKGKGFCFAAPEDLPAVKIFLFFPECLMMFQVAGFCYLAALLMWPAFFFSLVIVKEELE